MLEKGQSVGRYVIESVLGEGGMGTVYRATDVMLRRTVALKVVPLKDAEAMARFLREARAAAALQHPNIVAVYDVGEDEGRAYLALELVEGRALRDVIDDASASFTQRLSWLLDVAKALGAAHEKGFIHRDVKPDNVLLAPDGMAKLLDFGIAKNAEPGPASFRTKTGDLFGTPDYMAPEQWASSDVDARADQFAWGMMAYEVLSRRPLPQRERPPPLQTVARDVPDAVAACITKAFAHAANDRHFDMNAVVALLEPFVGAKPKQKGGTPDATLTQDALPSQVAGPPPPKAKEKTRRDRPAPALPPPRSSRTLVFALALAITCAMGAVVVAVLEHMKSSNAALASSATATPPSSTSTTPTPSNATTSQGLPPSSASAEIEPALDASRPTAVTGKPDAWAPTAPSRSGTVTMTVANVHSVCEVDNPTVVTDKNLMRLFDPRLPKITECLSRRLDRPIPDDYFKKQLRFRFKLLPDGSIGDLKSAQPPDLGECIARVVRGLNIGALPCDPASVVVELGHNCRCSPALSSGGNCAATTCAP